MISLEQLVAESVSLMGSVAEEKNITVSCEVPHDITVWADWQMLSTIIRNLLSNAIKFSPAGGSIGISARLTGDKKNKTAEVNIIDSGVGMESEVVSKLFHIDEHHSERVTADEKGTRLGLIICKDFIERDGGTIHAESQPGEGSKFIFTLETV